MSTYTLDIDMAVICSPNGTPIGNDGRYLVSGGVALVAELRRLAAQRDALLGACKGVLHPPEYDADEQPAPCGCASCVKLRAAIALAEGGAA